MLIKIGFDIEFELRGPTPMVLMLFVHPSREKDLRRAQELHVEPDLRVSYYTDLFGNRCAQLADAFRRAVMISAGLDQLISSLGQPWIDRQFRLALYEIATWRDQSRDGPDFRLGSWGHFTSG